MNRPIKMRGSFEIQQSLDLTDFILEGGNSLDLTRKQLDLLENPIDTVADAVSQAVGWPVIVAVCVEDDGDSIEAPWDDTPGDPP